MTLTYDNTGDRAPYTGDYALPVLTAAEYAKAAGVTERTVKRWLAADELPGARQDERGRWLIPADAQRTEPGELVTLAQRPMTRPMTEAVSHPVGVIDRLPSFLTIDEAAEILGISRHAITTHRDYFDVVPFGTNGSLVVPLATIKKIRG